MKTMVRPRRKNQIPSSLLPLARLRQGQNENRKSNGRDQLWAARSATAGATVWAGIAVLARMGIARMGAIEVLFLFAPLVIVPLGMELGRGLEEAGLAEEIAPRLQPLGAALAVAAMCLPPGRKAGLLASGWLMVCVVMAGGGWIALIRRFWADVAGSPHLTRVAMAIARVDLAIGGAWLVASRLGMRPMGIQEPVGLLTAVHFHYAGFATATIAASTLRFAERRAENSRGASGWWGWLWVCPSCWRRDLCFLLH